MASILTATRQRQGKPLRAPAPRQRKLEGSALEEAIMDAWEAGLCKRRIAAKLGLTLATVNRVLSYMADFGEGRLARKDMIAGSAMLASAILQARGMRVAA